jgi:glycerate 2-kinase
MTTPRGFLNTLFATAVAAAHPESFLRQYLPPIPSGGRLVILAGGKAAGSMAEIAERHYIATQTDLAARLAGIAVTRHGYGRPTQLVEMVEAGHPVPDAAGVAATERALTLAGAATREDLVLVLISGGASANWIAPAPGITLAAKQAVTRSLLRSGASITEINTVRKHLSRIKGGRLAARAAPARLVTCAISDVPGDDPAVIGSGPTVPDPTTLGDARAVVGRFGLELPASIEQALNDPRNESPKPGDPVFSGTRWQIVATPANAFAAAAAAVRAAGYDCILLGEHLEGEARDVAADHARIVRELAAGGRRAVVLSGGELTVTIRGDGRGGPNQEYALALAIAIDGMAGVSALSGDTDGTDGGSGAPDDPAGAIVDATTVSRARALSLDPAAFLANNDSTGFFARLGDLLTPGPTFTNVNDFRAILVDRV